MRGLCVRSRPEGMADHRAGGTGRTGGDCDAGRVNTDAVRQIPTV